MYVNFAGTTTMTGCTLYVQHLAPEEQENMMEKPELGYIGAAAQYHPPQSRYPPRIIV